MDVASGFRVALDNRRIFDDRLCVAILYKGAGPGTHWHVNDARAGGFFSAAFPATAAAAVQHISGYSHPSAFVSLSFSFDIAWGYGLIGPGGRATQTNPGKVYEVHTDLQPCELWNPVSLISGTERIPHEVLGSPIHHEGSAELILGIASQNHSALLQAVPRRTGGQQGPAGVAPSLRAIVLALRDSEVLAKSIPPGCIRHVHSVF